MLLSCVVSILVSKSYASLILSFGHSNSILEMEMELDEASIGHEQIISIKGPEIHVREVSEVIGTFIGIR